MNVMVYLRDGTKEKYTNIENIEREFDRLYLDTHNTSISFNYSDVKRLSVSYKYKAPKKKIEKSINIEVGQ